jgi:prolipoprotein diacylglyceryltransferase
MLDCMAIAGSAGIAVGRLASLFNASDRGMVVADTVGFPFAYPVVNAVSGVAENRLATFMIQSMLTGGIVIALLIFVLVSALRRKKVRDGDVCLLFLLAYGACQIVCDSTRYDSLFLRSNGFISIVQILGLVALLIPVILFSVRMVRNRGMKVWFIPVWLATAGLLGGAAYMEYYVQRHGDMAGFSYSVMSGCLAAVVALGLLMRKTGGLMSGSLTAAPETTGISVVRNISYGTVLPDVLSEGEIFILLSE